ncbi:MAG: DUF4405 domain-containing protein [Bacteroidales bacterium]|nr:DUF4405 domain-containing protein [Bacteroidales bacterium]
MKNWNRIKPKFNLVIDFIMMLVMMAVAGLGFLMKFVLLPGYKVNEVYGTEAELYFWGLDRHQWGAIHLYLALFLVFLLILHIVFHWDMILCIFRQMVSTSAIRVTFLVIIGLLSLFLALAPVFVKPEVAQLERKHQRNRVIDVQSAPYMEAVDEALPATPVRPVSPAGTNESDLEYNHHRHQNIDIVVDGTMTLGEVSEKYGVGVDELAKSIGVPAEYANERLGRLRKRYDFEMDDLRTYILRQKNSDKE